MDLAIADCSRLLLDTAPEEHAVSGALANLARGFDAPHAFLFRIKSYHAEDYRGQWLACSSNGECGCCRDIKAWDYLRIVPPDMRRLLEEGRSCLLGVRQLPPEFHPVFAGRDIDDLILIPLTVMGEWWGGLCIENTRGSLPWTSRRRGDLETLAALFAIYFERRQAVAGCQERDKLSGALEMAGTVCHKLNQPMQVILGYAGMVTSGDISDADQIKEIVQLIEDETRQMGIITKNLMGITKNRGVY